LGFISEEAVAVNFVFLVHASKADCKK